MNILYSLHVLTEVIFNDYDSVVNFSLDCEGLIINIKAKNGKTYHYKIDVMRTDENTIQEWLDKVPELFRQSLIDEALGKTYRD